MLHCNMVHSVSVWIGRCEVIESDVTNAHIYMISERGLLGSKYFVPPIDVMM